MSEEKKESPVIPYGEDKGPLSADRCVTFIERESDELAKQIMTIRDVFYRDMRARWNEEMGDPSDNDDKDTRESVLIRVIHAAVSTQIQSELAMVFLAARRTTMLRQILEASIKMFEKSAQIGMAVSTMAALEAELATDGTGTFPGNKKVELLLNVMKQLGVPSETMESIADAPVH